jgi:hypothetical protein
MNMPKKAIRIIVPLQGLLQKQICVFRKENTRCLSFQIRC